METQNGRKRKKASHRIDTAVWLVTATAISLSSILFGCAMFLLILKLLNVI
jgi:hypothetical protein